MPTLSNSVSYLKKKAEKWVSVLVLASCIGIMITLVYAAKQAQVWGDHLSSNNFEVPADAR